MQNTLPVKPRILHVTPEMAPLVKTGGLGDVTGSMPWAMRDMGVDCRVVMPAYPGVIEKAESMGFPCKKMPQNVHVSLNYRVYSARIWRSDVSGVPVYLLEQPELYNNPAVYPSEMNSTTALPFIFLGHAAIELAGPLRWKPQILHLHDWPAASAAVALRWHKWYGTSFSDYDTVLSIHNMAHQCIIPPHGTDGWGYSPAAMEVAGMEFYGQMNLLKGAIVASDMVTTVSPRYSWDIQTQEGGMGLDGVIRANRAKLKGILNGIDYRIWDTENDELLPCKYSALSMEGKLGCRRELEKMCGWEPSDAPILVFVGRLVPQKGIDLILSAMDQMVDNGNRIVIIGSGDSLMKDRVHAAASAHPGQVWCYTDFDEQTAHLAYAGGDILLMPSMFEPCGISQMIAMKYGTVPVARAVGGLADTVIDADGPPDGTGFLFIDYRPEEMIQAVQRAVWCLREGKRWDNIRYRGMTTDFSWAQSAQAYLGLYLELLGVDEKLS